MSDMYAGVMTGIEELRRKMTKRKDRVEERAHQGQEKLRDELTEVKSQARVDTWIEVMKLHFEEEIPSKKQECSALTSNLEGTALSCVMARRTHERDSARKIFDILLNCFGSGVQGHQAMVNLEKRLQRDDKSIDTFLDDLELLRRRSNADERISDVTWPLPQSSCME